MNIPQVFDRFLQTGWGGAKTAPMGITREQMTEALARADEPTRPATVALRKGLENAWQSCHAREKALEREITARQEELADVRRAKHAATAGLEDLGEPEIDEGAILAELETVGHD